MFDTFLFKNKKDQEKTPGQKQIQKGSKGNPRSKKSSSNPQSNSGNKNKKKFQSSKSFNQQRPGQNNKKKSSHPGKNQSNQPQKNAGKKGFSKQASAKNSRPQTASPGKNSASAKKKILDLSNFPGLKIMPLGGCEEVGRNMTLFEYQNDIVILDMGLQFPEEDMPGIDYIIPNIKYLQGKEKRIRGVIFSHGHLDHIGAAPILLEKLNYPPVIARDLTLALIRHRQEDYQKGSSKRLKTRKINQVSDEFKLGKFTLNFFQIEHSIMDAVGVILKTPEGTVIHPGDWTMERDSQGRSTLDYSHLSRLPRPTALMLESLGSLKEEPSPNSQEVYNNLYQIITGAQGRVIIGTFASQVERIKWIIDSSQKLGKKVALDGYSMKMNVEMTRKMGYLKFDKNVLIDIKKINTYPDNKVVVICTGAQGEENAVLSRIVDRSHRFIQLKKNDTIIFSSSVIPGNERTIQRLKDNIYRQCDNVYHNEIMDVHVSGHASRDDIWEMVKTANPDFFIPVYANHYFLKEAGNLVARRGFPAKNVLVPDNGSVIQINQSQARLLDKKVPHDYVFVDGLGITDMQNIVLRDRQTLAEDGMVVVIITVESKTGNLVQNPDLISRGFVFLKENKELIESMRQKVRQMVAKSDPLTWTDTNKIRNTLRDEVGKFLFQETQKRPMVLPVVIEV